MKLVSTLALCLSLLFATQSGYASDEVIGNGDDDYIAAELIPESTKWGVSYPGQAITTNRSGAVELVYVVDISGKPTEMVVSAYTHEMFIKKALQSTNQRHGWHEGPFNRGVGINNVLRLSLIYKSGPSFVLHS